MKGSGKRMQKDTKIKTKMKSRSIAMATLFKKIVKTFQMIKAWTRVDSNKDLFSKRWQWL